MMKVNLSTKIKRDREVISHVVGNKSYILDPRSSTLRVLNDTGGFVWNQTRNPVTVEEIVDKLCLAYDVPRKIAQKDTLEFIQRYLQERILLKAG